MCHPSVYMLKTPNNKYWRHDISMRSSSAASGFGLINSGIDSVKLEFFYSRTILLRQAINLLIYCPVIHLVLRLYSELD